LAGSIGPIPHFVLRFVHSAVELVWLKRDLRLVDHQPLAEAARRGPVVALHVFEPDVLHAPEYDGQHLAYQLEALRELSSSLARRGVPLLLRTGRVPQVFAQLRRELPFVRLWSHEETGLLATFARDLRVGEWAREAGVEWRELPQTGVVRRLKSRDGWARLWSERMEAEQARLVVPPRWRLARVPDPVPEREVLGIEARWRGEAGWSNHGRAGESAARRVLADFLEQRGLDYVPAMSAPGPARTGCSRLSEHLAFGAISMRVVWQATRARLAELQARIEVARGAESARKRLSAATATPEVARLLRWRRSLSAFAQRLHWHCHFMQKLEDKPDLERRNLHSGHDGLREAEFDASRFAAWKAGATGYPMVDACLRSLVASGWLNFRMRAMLMSFAAYHLWLHWREPAQWLGAQFLDFEPGIHYAQAQMQSGTTGINTLRMYSPRKQAQDHDPRGEFIRRFVPELAGVPDEHLAEPHLMTRAEQEAAGCRVGRDYPAPVVDHKEAIAAARARFGALRRDPAVRAESKEVLRRHGSRKRPAGARRRAGTGRTRPAEADAARDDVARQATLFDIGEAD
jgi:deoxyribodipyrimidine photo-lyase